MRPPPTHQRSVAAPAIMAATAFATLVGLVGLAGTASALTISPLTVTFGPQAVGTESQASIVTIYEDYNPASPAPSASATATADFRAGAVGCGRTSCSIAVYFRPTHTGASNATLTIVDNFGAAHQVPLSGVGEASMTASSSGVPATLGMAAVGTLGLLGGQLLSRRRRRLR